jgi:GNAT superfamily N-acetyltransferase
MAGRATGRDVRGALGRVHCFRSAGAVGNCPETNGRFVWPESLRSHGIGTAFIRRAEDRARERGMRRLGVGVRTHNIRAAALYRQLGYRLFTSYVDRYTYRDDEGFLHHMADSCTFMISSLGRTA